MLDLHWMALDRFVEQCRESGHEYCEGTSSCLATAGAYQQRLGREAQAQSFDVGKMLVQCGDEMPGHDWSTTALMRTVNDLVLAPPFRDPLRRSCAVTTALARLAERGFPPDAAVRTCLGPALTRVVLVRIAAFWCAERQGELRRESLHPNLRAWLELLDADERIAERGLDSLTPVAAAALAGPPAAQAREWVRTAAIAHILAWKLDDDLRVNRLPEEVVLPAGKDATRWVFDRFTKTYIDEWTESSLAWELVLNRQPAMTAERVGLPLSLLGERVVTDDMLIASMDRRLTGPDVHDVVDGGLRVDEIIESIVALLEAGQLDGARILARRSFEAAPQMTFLRMAFAFCSIPTHREQAQAVLDCFDPADVREASLVQINRATCQLFDGDLPSARGLVADLDSQGDCEGEAWLWDPLAAVESRAVIRYMSHADWIQEVGALVPSES
jgi:hypothetical protein